MRRFGCHSRQQRTPNTFCMHLALRFIKETLGSMDGGISLARCIKSDAITCFLGVNGYKQGNDEAQMFTQYSVYTVECELAQPKGNANA